MKEIWLKIITRAWNEPDFKTRLLANPNEVLKEYHVDIPEGVTYVVKEDELKGTRYLVLPPQSGDEDDDTLKIDTFGRHAQSGDPGF